MKSLKAIQTIAKIGKILSSIVFVFCIVGCSLCFVGLICLIAGVDAIKVGEVTLGSIIETKGEVSINSVYASMIIGMVICGMEIYIAKLSDIYFKMELENGHPFTEELVTRLRKLGLIMLIVPFVVSILCSIGIDIAEKAVGEDFGIKINSIISVGLALGFIVVSYICEYVVEKEKQVNRDNDNEELSDDKNY